MQTDRFMNKVFTIALLTVPLFLSSATIVRAQGAVAKEDPFDQEVRFISGMVDWGLPGYAEKYLSKYLIDHPEMKTRAGPLQIEILAGAGKFAEAQALIKTLPSNSVEAWKMKLALADRLYDWNKLNDARVIYDDFFKAYPSGPTPELKQFYMESAYKYGQMLLLKKEDKAAVRTYEFVLLAKPDPEVEANVQIDLAELCVRVGEGSSGGERGNYFQKAKDICNKILWKGISDDPNRISVFTKALVIEAHMMSIDGSKREAIKMINGYMPMLKNLEDALKQSKLSLSYSPMPECRYLLGSLSQEEGEAMIKAGKKEDGGKLLVQAVEHFVNVYGKYPSSPWALEAGERTSKLKAILKAQGVKITIPDFDMKPILMAQLSDAQTLLAQNQYKEAVPKYLAAVNAVPEQELSISALGDLIKCYAALGDTNYLYTIMGYVAERFSKNSKLDEHAGNVLLRTAEAATANKDVELSKHAYELYFKNFKNHTKLTPTLYHFGETSVADKNYDAALGYFQQVTNYPNDALYMPALSSASYCYMMLNDYTNALQILTKCLANAKPSPAMLDVKFRLGDVYRRMDNLPKAINEYTEILKIVDSGQKTNYMVGADAEAKLKSVAERALFGKASCFARLKEPADKVKSYQDKAIDDFRKFMKDYPQSQLAPQVLSRLGTLLLVKGNSDEANKVFDKLAKEYKDSDEAKNAVFQQAVSLLDLGMKEKALEVFKRMLDNEKSFSAQQFLRAAKFLYEAKDYATALKFFEKARAGSQVKEVWEPATLGFAQCSFETGNAKDAVKVIDELTKKNPSSAQTVEACFVKAKACADIGSKEADPKAKVAYFNQAVQAMNMARRIARDAETTVKVEVQLADMQLLMGTKEGKDGAAATYNRMLMFRDWNDAKTRPYIDQAFGKGIPLLLEKELNEDVVSLCDTYLQTFPNGRWSNDARKWRGVAQVKLATSGGGSRGEGGAIAPVKDSAIPAPAAPAPEAPAADNGQ
jgi:tetratricopeptide (TPR) repeat protein